MVYWGVIGVLTIFIFCRCIDVY